MIGSLTFVFGKRHARVIRLGIFVILLFFVLLKIFVLLFVRRNLPTAGKFFTLPEERALS